MAYNVNLELPSRWTTNQCDSSYTNYGVFCKCEKLNNFYFGIVNDLTRNLVVAEEPDI